jgi:hypothetical protein
MSQPAAEVAAAAQPQGRGPAARQGGGGGLGQSIAGIVRMAVFWYFAAKFFGPKRPPAEPGMLMSNLFQKGEPMVRTPSSLLVVSRILVRRCVLGVFGGSFTSRCRVVRVIRSVCSDAKVI